MSVATYANTGYIAQGAYTAPTEIISAAAQVQVLAQTAKLKNLLSGEPIAGSHLDEISPAVRNMLQIEIVALETAIDAAPTA